MSKVGQYVLIAACFLMLHGTVTTAAIIISEVDPEGNGLTNYGADWFELTNTGSTDVAVNGWKMDDDSDSFALAVPIRGITSIAAKQSVLMIESNASGTSDTPIQTAFDQAWFGSNVPANLTIAFYGGAGVGLSAKSDQVNVFDSAGNSIAAVSFGASTPGFTFDNSAGLNGVAISTLSVAGVNGGFLAAGGTEVGSPGTVSNPVPEPAAMLSSIILVPLIGRTRRSV